jgi:hypothetical protein
VLPTAAITEAKHRPISDIQATFILITHKSMRSKLKWDFQLYFSPLEKFFFQKNGSWHFFLCQ